MILVMEHPLHSVKTVLHLLRLQDDDTDQHATRCLHSVKTVLRLLRPCNLLSQITVSQFIGHP
jgi:hypothetical protein